MHANTVCAGFPSIRGDSLLKRGISNAISSQCALMKEWRSMLGASMAMVCDGLPLLSAWPSFIDDAQDTSGHPTLRQRSKTVRLHSY